MQEHKFHEVVKVIFQKGTFVVYINVHVQILVCTYSRFPDAFTRPMDVCVCVCVRMLYGSVSSQKIYVPPGNRSSVYFNAFCECHKA